MDLQLKDKLVIVTGSTAGIGKAIALEFARHGSYVIVNGRNRDSTNRAVQDIMDQTNAARDHVFDVVGDVSTAEGVTSFIKEVTQIESNLKRRVECLVNNVGMFHIQDFVDVDDDKWLAYYQTNTMSGVRLSRHYLPEMLDRNSGRIIFISSDVGLRPIPNMLAYSVSKSSQLSLSRGLAEMTKGTKVTVNSVLPGPTMTEGVKTVMDNMVERQQQRGGTGDREEAVKGFFMDQEPTSLLQRFLTPKEIADVTVFLCSPLASGISGTAQHVDGGIVRHLS